MKNFLPSLYVLVFILGNAAYAQLPDLDESDVQPSISPSIKEICALPTPAIIEIHTNDEVPIQSKEVYVDAQITIREALPDGNGFSEYTYATRIRGRGNSTWRMEKKPYRLNLNEARSLLGLPAARNWALLANHADKTMLRNAIALCLGRVMEMEWTPGFRFAELYLNDEYQGLYQLTDHIETGEHRVNIGARKESSVPGDIGFLMEIDKHMDEKQWFLGNIFATPYAIKGKLSSEEAVEAAAFINRMELGFIKKIIQKNNSYFPDSQNHPNFINYKDYIELESFVNFYLINEFLKNLDAFFYSSTFVYRPWGEKLRFGPLWDFDSAAGNADEYGMEDPHGWWTREISVYVQNALSDPEFNDRIKDRWNFLYARISELFDFIDSAATGLDGAQKRNFERWPILDRIVWRNPEIHYTYEGEVAHLKNWLQKRAMWINSELSSSTTQ
uniref:Spore coat protein CotH n=1 Tax=Candidatus Nitrotoga fabula TaxID=2182327 RepID=A0A2X0SIF4_9PROT